MLPSNVGHLFEAARLLTPERTALIDAGDGDRTFSYAQLEARCEWVASGLRRLGLGTGARVMLLFPNEYRYVESLFGTVRAGLIAVPTNVRLGFETLCFIAEDSGASVLIASASLAELADRLAAAVPSLATVLCDGARHPKARSYDAWLADAEIRPGGDSGRESGESRADGAADGAADLPADTAMLPYTSGSTGRPKGVPLTHAGLLWCFDSQRKVMLLDQTERALVAVPAYHVNGMAGALAPFLLAGGSVVLLPGFEPLSVIRAIAAHRVTYMTGVPAMYYALLEQREALASQDLSSLRFVNVGSATSPPELLRRIGEAFGVPVLEGYGLTEGGPVNAKLPRFGIRKAGSCGLPFPGAEFKVMALDGQRELGTDQVGELWVRTPGNTRGYYRRPDLTRERLLPDGWLKTGDLGRCDEDGYLYFVGRKDDMINCGGENVYPKEVEDLLLRHPSVAEACVVPAPHPTKGHAPVAYVVPRADCPSDETALKQYCLENGPAYAHPRRIYLLESLPLTPIGKPDRLALAARAIDRGSSSTGVSS